MVQTRNHILKSQSLPPFPANGGCGGGVGLIDLRSMSYTSLKDLLPSSPPPTPKIRWNDIRIRDPLVQCAAWAYLQPMAETRDDGGGVFSLKRLKKTCCDLFGCFSDVVLVVGRRLFE